MTLDQLWTEVGARLNLTSDESEARVKRELNEAYRRVSSSIGLQLSRRSVGVTVNTIQDDPTVTFTLEKVERVYIPSARDVLDEITFDEIREANIELATGGVPRRYAIQSSTASTVTLCLNPIPSSVIAIYADGVVNASTLGDSDSPAFAADYHDVLIHDVLKTEYMKLEKPQLAGIAKSDFEERLAQLRYFIVKSNSLATVQGSRLGGRRTLKHNGNRIA
jgi:hypothetical protein